MDVPVTPGPAIPVAPPAATGAVSERSQARRETIRQLLHRPAFIIGNVVIIGWIITAVLGQRITPYDPFNDFFVGHLPPSSEHWMGTTMLFAAENKDLPMLTAGVIIIGIVYMLATLASDLTIAWMNPRIRLDADR